MCTKECCIVLTRSKLFWGQFWGQICKTDSDPQRSNKCATLVSLQNWDTDITGFSHRKSPKNQYISFILQQEVVRKPTLRHPRTPPLSPRETPLFGRVRAASVPMPAQPYTAPNFPSLRLFCPRTAFPVQALPGRFSPVQEKPAQISNQINRILKKKIMFTTLAAASAGIGKLKTNKKAAGNRLRLPAALFSKGQFSFSSAHPPGR